MLIPVKTWRYSENGSCLWGVCDFRFFRGEEYPHEGLHFSRSEVSVSWWVGECKLGDCGITAGAESRCHGLRCTERLPEEGGPTHRRWRDRKGESREEENIYNPSIFPNPYTYEGVGLLQDRSWADHKDAQLVKNLPAIQETWVRFLGWEDPLEKGKATHSCILAWRIPRTVQSMGSHRVRHDWVTFTFTFFRG